MVLDFQRIFYIEYSLGLPKEELARNQDILIEALLGCWTAKGGAYNDMFFTLCVAIIYDMPKDKIEPVANLLVERKYKDYVLDSMLNHMLPEFPIRTEEIKFKKSFKPTTEIIRLAESDKNAAVQRLKKYLEKEWLNMRKDGMMHNKSHLKEKTFEYLGYWCIEAAALVIMLGLDDTTLKDCAYYPSDLI